MPTATRQLMNTQWTRLQPYLRACPGIYVGHAVRSRLLVEAGVWIARAGALWGQVREMELGVSPVCGLVQPGYLGAPDAIHAGRPVSVRCAAGQHDCVRARECRRPPCPV